MMLIFPSLMALNFARLGEDLDQVQKAGASTLHVDVMDGHYGKEVTVGLPVVESLAKSCPLGIDVRLAVERPERYAGEFVKAGARRVAVHPDSTNHLFRTLRSIREHGAEAGAALSPGIPLAVLDDVRSELDFVSLVCAEWNRRQERFLPQSIQKIRFASNLKSESGGRIKIQVEGGIEIAHIGELAANGVDVIVAGPAALAGAPTGERVMALIHEAENVHKIIVDLQAPQDS
ncbi:MAG TPA: ribulose-phosphate 3-epimerase [Terriglobia bacterium]|nr:ribulose-phosphate 3-epimerase [Terriglobia bacterium]